MELHTVVVAVRYQRNGRTELEEKLNTCANKLVVISSACRTVFILLIWDGIASIDFSFKLKYCFKVMGGGRDM